MFNSNFIINLKELQIRSVYVFISFFLTFLISFLKKIELFFFISKYFLYFEEGFIYTNLLDPLIIYIKLALWFTIIFTIPIIVYIYSFFFAKAIYEFYYTYILLYFISFYFGGISLFLVWYFKIFPIVIKFLIQFQRLEVFSPMKLVLKATITNYFSFFYGFFWLFIIIFFISNIFLLYLHIFNEQVLKKKYYRQFLYLLICILILTFAPPDFILHLIIFPFMIIFVEIIIYFVMFWYNIYNIYVKS